jgi:hypothetical protein
MPHLQSEAWYAYNSKLQEIARYLTDEDWQCEAIYADPMMLTSCAAAWLDQEILTARQDDWRGNPVKERSTIRSTESCARRSRNRAHC